MAGVPKIEPREAQQRLARGEAVLVCAYDDEERCRGLRLEGALTLGELQAREEDLREERDVVFYCT